MIQSIILITLAHIFSTIGIAYLIRNKEKYVIDLTEKILISLYLFIEAIYFLFFNLSFVVVFPIFFVKNFWKISLLLRVFKLSLLSSTHVYILFKNRFAYLPFFIYGFLGGIIASFLILGTPFNISIYEGNYLFIINNSLFYNLILIFNILVIIIGILAQLKGSKNISFENIANLFIIILSLLLLNTFLYTLFLAFPSSYLRFLYSIVFLSFLGVAVFITIKEFELFVVVTNKIYNFVIFHRSGVLLFSYDFEENKEIEESLLKGTILIGINHILSSFINKKSKLNLIKMKERDIIFEYDNNYGYAILLIASHRSNIIDKAVHLFMKDFSQINNQILNKINQQAQLIDVSQFKDSKNIIKKYFKPFLS
ncbi:MAG: hypothetical protein ACQERB_10070 [Promethearchaeati archaeon]